MRLALAVGLLLGCMGCQAPPPKLLDASPRFQVGAERVEGIEAFAELRTIAKDFSTHFGLMWEAKVRSSDAAGTLIEATIVRVVAQLPGEILTIDTDSLIPLGRLVGLGRIFFKLIGLEFRYVIEPSGQVKLSGWEETVDAAARAAGEAVPRDGQIPPSGLLQDALARVYRAPPYRQIALHETWRRPSDYRLSTDAGPAVSGTAEFGYVGMGDQEFVFGKEDVRLEGASVKFSGVADVTQEGDTIFGVVPVQQGQRRGELLFNRRGDELLMYRELDELKIKPRLELGKVEVAVELVNYRTGWVFFAESPWKD